MPPDGVDELGISQRCERRLIEAFVPEVAIAALDEAVLQRVARDDGIPLDPALLRPALVWTALLAAYQLDDVRAVQKRGAVHLPILDRSGPGAKCQDLQFFNRPSCSHRA